MIDVKISVDPYITVEEGHAIARKVKQNLQNKHADIEDVLVHVNPYNKDS